MDKTVAKATFWANGIRMEIELTRYPDSRLALTGVSEGSAGQCQDSIESAAGDTSPELNRILEIWEADHLKPVTDGRFAEAEALIRKLDDQRFGETPDVADAPDLGGDWIDSRDAIKRLEIYRQAVIQLGIPEEEVDTFDNGANWPVSAPEDMGDDSDIIDEFLALREFCEEGERAAVDWYYGETAIAASYFTEYAEETCKDHGYIADDFPGWIAIDWEKTAEAMKMDYTEISYHGEVYLIR